MEFFSRLPIELINTILSFDKHFTIRKGEPVTIIPKDDPRRELLLKKQLLNGGYVHITTMAEIPVIIDVFSFFSTMYQKTMYEWRMVVFHRKEGREIYYTKRIQ
jgi:hypothetical protein